MKLLLLISDWAYARETARRLRLREDRGEWRVVPSPFGIQLKEIYWDPTGQTLATEVVRELCPLIFGDEP